MTPLLVPLPSGETIELAVSGNGSPPDRQGGQHTNVLDAKARGEI